MKERLKNKLMGIVQAVDRYPLSMLFLVAIATINAVSIQKEAEHDSKYLFTFIVGAMLSVVSQQVYERFCTKASQRFMLMGGSLLLAAGYYLAIRSAPVFNIEISTKTAVAMFALLMAFIWVPSIKSKVTFNESFMSAFKAFFITALFSAVLAGGISSIIFAIDQLLFSITYKAHSHAMNIIFSLFSPIFFLSFTPRYPGKKDADQSTEALEKVEKAVSVPKMLEILISYVIIPLTAVYTIILLVYVLLNFRGDFWANNLLEPMLVSYTIIVILVYILASSLDNQFAALFRKIFPKILIPIVLFQTIASILKISEAGVTHGRYYVIMFGIFALMAGILFSFFPVKKNGWIAAVLIIFSAISIIPPIDAFTVSRVNQVNLLVETLSENNMFEDGKIVPNSAISAEDKKTITRTVSYLDSMNYLEKIDWLPNKIFYDDHFKNTFGFDEVYDETGRDNEAQYAHLDWEQSPVVNIEQYDRMIHLTVYNEEEEDSGKEIPIEINNTNYILTKQLEEEYFNLHLVDEQDEELIRVNSKEVFDEILGDEETYGGEGKTLSVKKATVTRENNKVRMDFLITSVNHYDDQYFADMFVFLKIK
ncbi:DUF4153 domain-containing protein [Siminovitchia sp. 179-K 8D1 HS]|uniref:DUF4153 domain-containing protein n=1 Tax=Siminovitchia sp. 179-K 8D1 HS TaxID=3142385 RepID=UPI0039A074D6